MVDEVVAAEGDEKTPEQLATEQVAQVAQAEVEARAVRQGWTTKDKFRGDPEKWVDAATFVQRGDNMLPILRERNRAMDERLVRQEHTITKLAADSEELKARLDESTSVIRQSIEYSRKAEERAFKRATTELKARMDAAAASGDTMAYRVARDELDGLDRDKPDAAPPPVAERKEPPKQAPQVDPEIPAWITENQWYERDSELRMFANALSQQLAATRPSMSMRDNLAETKRQIMQRFPEKFENPKREAPASVASPTAPPSASRKKGKSFDDIPAADRRPYDDFKRWMPDFTKEEFAATYFAGDE